MVADVSPGAKDLDLLDLGAGVNRDAFRAFDVGCELRLSKRRPARRHKDNVVGHHVRKRREIVSLAGRNPGSDELADLAFVVLVGAQDSSLPATPASANVAMPLWQAIAALTIPTARAAPDPSPSRIPKSNNGVLPISFRACRCARSAET